MIEHPAPMTSEEEHTNTRETNEAEDITPESDNNVVASIAHEPRR